MPASVIFESAQRVIAQVLSWFQTSGQTRVSTLVQDVFQTGIDNSTTIGEGFIVVPGSNNTPSTPTISVTTGGIAYDVNSNRIYVNPSDSTLYNPSSPLDTTNDGLGNMILTPQSTGVVNIPLTQTSLNYLWVDYLATIDTSVYTLNKITHAKQFYKQTDGYEITVTTVNIAPTAASVFLATIDMTGGGAVSPSNISQTGRTYFNLLPNIIPIKTAQANRSDATAVYNPNTTYVLETHIKAVGTGPVNATNPHGTSLADMGVTALDTVTGHRQLEHGNAIIAGVPGGPFPTTSAMATSTNIVNPGSDYLTVFQLLSTEFAIVNGVAYNVTDIFGAVPVNANIFFASLPSGVYNVYWDSVVKSFSTSTADISSDVTKLWIATVTWTFVGTGPSDHNALSALTDRRRIGSTTHLTERWYNTGRPGVGSTQPLAGEFGFNLNASALEYWDGTAWQQPVTVASNVIVPTGAILPFAGVSAPSGFLLADGSAVSRTTYAALYALIGIIYGAGNGSTTFNIPNLVNNVPVGAGSIVSLGATTGEQTHTLITSEMPTHNHPANSIVTDPSHSHSIQVNYDGSGPNNGEHVRSQLLTSVTGTLAGPVQPQFTGISVGTTTSNVGGGGAHNNMQPSIGINYIIKY